MTVLEITPGAGEYVGEDTVISATVEYAIDEYAPDDEYRLAPVFEGGQEGGTFNALPGMGSWYLLRSNTGFAAVRHPIRAEWRSGQLRTPVQLWFVLVRMTGPNRSQIIGRAGPIEYVAGPGENVPRTGATVTVEEIHPEVGALVGEETVLIARVAFTIHDPLPEHEHRLLIVFEGPEEGRTFNATPDTEQELESNTGSITVRHPIQAEWRTGNLIDPVRVWFYVVRVTDTDTSRIIGRAGPIEYRTGSRSNR